MESLHMANLVAKAHHLSAGACSVVKRKQIAMLLAKGCVEQARRPAAAGPGAVVEPYLWVRYVFNHKI